MPMWIAREIVPVMTTHSRNGYSRGQLKGALLRFYLAGTIKTVVPILRNLFREGGCDAIRSAALTLLKSHSTSSTVPALAKKRKDGAPTVSVREGNITGHDGPPAPYNSRGDHYKTTPSDIIKIGRAYQPR